MWGMVNLRRQIKRHHYPQEEEGKPPQQMRPKKIDDDLVDCLRAFATHRWPQRPPLSQAERDELSLPPHLQWKFVSRIQDPQVKSMALSSRDMALKRILYEREEGAGHRRFSYGAGMGGRPHFRRDGSVTRVQSFDEWGEPINGDGYFQASLKTAGKQ